MKKSIAIVTGGNSSEHVVSLRSAALVEASLDKKIYNTYKVIIRGSSWIVSQQGKDDLPVCKGDFSFTENGEKKSFDCAFIIIHGTPGEDGILQGYFDLLGIPYTSSGVLASSLAFNKWMCKKYLANADVTMPDGVLIRKGESVDAVEIVGKLGLPIFIKPNEGGSSFGVTKVKSVNDMQRALEGGFAEDMNVIAEEFIDGTELTCGLMEIDGELVAFPVTEIVSKKEFFDYEAKYTPSMCDEITPARISEEVTKLTQDTSKRIYRMLDCRGIVRIDYIYSKNKLYFLEVNTVPGMTEASLVPKQIQAMGESLSRLFSLLIEDSIAYHRK